MSFQLGDSTRAVAVGLVLLLPVLVPVPDAFAQTCPPQEVTATVTPADGSAPLGQVTAVCNSPQCWPRSADWGTFQVGVPGGGPYKFSVFSGYYFQRDNQGDANCPYQESTGCYVCTGSVTTELYARFGNIKGRVMQMPSGLPAEGIHVGVVHPYATQTNALGFYDFCQGVVEWCANNWGIEVSDTNPANPGSGIGRATYTMQAGSELRTVNVQSSLSTIANFFIWNPAAQPPDIRPCEHCPQAPAATGRPVSLATGNVFFDQEDGTVSGVGTALRFVRSYNSDNRGTGTYGVFGRGWQHSYERRVSTPSTGVLMLRRANGVPQYFSDPDADNRYDTTVPYMQHSWFEKQPDGTFVHEFHDGSSETYGTIANNGRLESMTDSSNNETTLGYNGSGQLITITAPGGRALTLTYSDGRLATLSGPAGTIATYSYTGTLLTGVEYADASSSGFAFAYLAGSDALTSVTDLSGRKVETHEYDAAGRGITSEIADGQDKYTFEFLPNQTIVRDVLGNVTTYDIEQVWGQRLVTKVTGACDSCGSSSETQEWTYDDRGRVLTHTDADGKVTSYTYDATTGDVLTVTETKGIDSRTTTYTYAHTGRIESVTAPDSGTVEYVQGPAGPTSITDAINRTTAITYRSDGQVSTVTDPRLKTTTFGYDATTGDLTSVTDPLSHATTFRYDAMGRRDRVTDALTNATTSLYDVRGRLTRVTTPDNKFTTFTYDSGGRRSEVTDPMGRVTRYLYDAYGRLEAVTDPLGGVTRYAYDAMSRLSALTDARGQTTRFEYDGFGRVKTVRYPGGGAEVFTYTSAGRLLTRTDRKAVVTTYEYDSFGRLKRKTYSDSTPEVTYTYDGADRLKTAANGTDSLGWNYDLAGQLLNEGSTRNSSTVAYTYDNGGNRQTVSLDGQLFVTYGYDDAARLTSITRGTNVFGFGYDNANRRTGMTYPNGVATTYGYDTLSRLTSLGALAGSTVVTSFGYTYDEAGNRTTKTSPEFTETYSYDPLYRLTGVDRSAGSPARWVYGYDPVGNRLFAQVDNSVQSGVYNTQNQLLSLTGGGPLLVRGSVDEAAQVKVNGQPARLLPGSAFEATISAAPGTNTFTVEATDARGNVRTSTYEANVSGNGATYTYDSNGNLTQKTEGSDTWTYEWDAENRLKRVLKNAAEVARFAYDPLGRRVEKVAGATTTAWTHDGEDILREVSGATTLKYVHGPGIDEPLAHEDGAGALSFFQADGLGSIVKTTNSAGTVTSTRRYDSFGNLEVGATNGYAFTGREWDAETGLAFSRARYYDPKEGRFISEDPLRFDGGYNFYAYVDNNPIVRIDPDGRAPISIPGGPVFAGAAGYVALCGIGTYQYAEWEIRQGRTQTVDPTNSQQTHCRTACRLNRCLIGVLPSVTLAAQYSLEAARAPDKWGDSLWDDMAAEAGVWYSYRFWKSCDELCAPMCKFPGN
jgi:RHS repeat-associated protein